MAQLTDTLVSGDERVTGMIYGTQAGNYATCSSGASAVKTVTIPGFVLTTGVHVRIKFTNTNTLAVASLTLNVSATGAKAIKVKGNNLAAAGDLAANGVYEFVYDGTNWELTGAVPTSHAHGNIANGGTLTDTAAAAAGNDYVVIRDADNAKIQTSTIKGTDVADAVSKKHSHTSITVTKTATQYDGSHTLKLPDSDPYTSARTPTSHADANGAYGKATTANFGHVQLATGDMNGAANVDGVAVSKNHTHSQYLPASSSSSIYGFMFKKPLDGGSWYDGYGFSMMTFYGGSGHLYEIGVRLQGSTSSNPFPSGSRLAVTVIGDDELHVLGFNSNVWYKIVDNELQIIFLTPFTSTTNTTRIHMPGIVTRDKALTTSNSTILTASEWESATESVLVAAGWTHKDSSEVVFRRTLLSEGTTLPISKGGTAKTTRKAATNNLFSDIASATSNVTGESQLVFKYASPSDTNGIFYYRTASYLWSWLQTQLGYNSSSNKYGINISGTCALADQAYAFTEGVGNGSRPIYIDSNGFPQAVGMSTAHPTYLNLNVVSSYAAAHATDADTVDGVHMHIGYSAAESTVCFF